MIYLGSDHAGFELKESIKDALEKKGANYLDLGTDSFAINFFHNKNNLVHCKINYIILYVRRYMKRHSEPF